MAKQVRSIKPELSVEEAEKRIKEHANQTLKAFHSELELLMKKYNVQPSVLFNYNSLGTKINQVIQSERKEIVFSIIPPK